MVPKIPVLNPIFAFCICVKNNRNPLPFEVRIEVRNLVRRKRYHIAILKVELESQLLKTQIPSLTILGNQ
jgi:hypothetical protein